MTLSCNRYVTGRSLMSHILCLSLGQVEYACLLHTTGQQEAPTIDIPTSQQNDIERSQCFGLWLPGTRGGLCDSIAGTQWLLHEYQQDCHRRYVLHHTDMQTECTGSQSINPSINYKVCSGSSIIHQTM